MKTEYWLDKLGITGIILGTADVAYRLIAEERYNGPEQIDEGMGIVTAGLAAWDVSKSIREREQRIKRSPLVHFGRGLKIAGAAGTFYLLEKGDSSLGAFCPAAIGISLGAFFEYVVGPIHELIEGERSYQTDQ